jgi:hypothetical protein
MRNECIEISLTWKFFNLINLLDLSQLFRDVRQSLLGTLYPLFAINILLRYALSPVLRANTGTIQKTMDDFIGQLRFFI